MPGIAHTPRRRADTVSHDRNPGTPGALEIAGAGLLPENVRLVRRISQLRGTLEAAVRDNADLRRRLAHARRENDQLHHPTPIRVGERRAQWRDALAEPWSRNP
jgi:hypothetical protein